jgi:anti-sigma factor RsiW
VNDETQLLLRYLDGELSPVEAERFRARLADSPELCRELERMQQVGALLRVWSKTAEARGAELLEPTLRQVEARHNARRRRSVYGTLACGLATGLLFVLRGSPGSLTATPRVEYLHAAHFLEGAAIERVEASDQRAQVFVVGRASTPVVWLVDEAQDDDGPPNQDPG